MCTQEARREGAAISCVTEKGGRLQLLGDATRQQGPVLGSRWWCGWSLVGSGGRCGGCCNSIAGKNEAKREKRKENEREIEEGLPAVTRAMVVRPEVTVAGG